MHPHRLPGPQCPHFEEGGSLTNSCPLSISHHLWDHHCIGGGPGVRVEGVHHGIPLSFCSGKVNVCAGHFFKGGEKGYVVKMTYL